MIVISLFFCLKANCCIAENFKNKFRENPRRAQVLRGAEDALAYDSVTTCVTEHHDKLQAVSPCFAIATTVKKTTTIVVLRLYYIIYALSTTLFILQQAHQLYVSYLFGYFRYIRTFSNPGIFYSKVLAIGCQSSLHFRRYIYSFPHYITISVGRWKPVPKQMATRHHHRMRNRCQLSMKTNVRVHTCNSCLSCRLPCPFVLFLNTYSSLPQFLFKNLKSHQGFFFK